MCSSFRPKKSALKHATLTRVHLWKTELPGARDGRGLNECQLFSITKLEKVFHINGLFRATNTDIFFPLPQVTFFSCCALKDAALTLAVHVSAVTDVLEKSEHFTLFSKLKKLHAFVLGHFEFTELRYLNGKSQIIAALIESRFSPH